MSQLPALKFHSNWRAGFGVMTIDKNDRITSILWKSPSEPEGMPDRPDFSLVSMGIYVFKTKFLLDQLRRDAATPGSSRDFGKDVIPYLVRNAKAVAHRFGQSCVRSSSENHAYWRDVGTVDAYWEANIDLTDLVPQLDLYDHSWPLWTYAEVAPPAKFVHDIDGRRGSAVSSPGFRRLHRLGCPYPAQPAFHGGAGK